MECQIASRRSHRYAAGHRQPKLGCLHQLWTSMKSWLAAVEPQAEHVAPSLSSACRLTARTGQTVSRAGSATRSEVLTGASKEHPGPMPEVLGRSSATCVLTIRRISCYVSFCSSQTTERYRSLDLAGHLELRVVFHTDSRRYCSLMALPSTALHVGEALCSRAAAGSFEADWVA